MKKADSEPDVKMMDLYGQYYITQGQNEKAEEYYEKIKKKDHHYKNYLLGASKRYVQIKKLDDAEKYAREYVKSRASRGEGYNMLGNVDQIVFHAFSPCFYLILIFFASCSIRAWIAFMTGIATLTTLRS